MEDERLDLFDESILEQDDYYEDDGFSDLEDSPNKEEIEDLKKEKIPKDVDSILRWLVDKAVAIVIILIVFAFLFLGGVLLYHMTRSTTDVGGIQDAVDMLRW